MNDCVAGVASVLPAASVARTETLCAPSARAPVVHGLVQSAQAPASTRHSKTEFASVAVNAKLGVLSVVVPVGPDVMAVSGGVVSDGGGGGGVAPQLFRPMSVPSDAVPLGEAVAYAQRPLPPV
ncbi:MAG TPA: hypothetical protein VF024_04050 [Solirubrobacteraceae bacterium]